VSYDFRLAFEKRGNFHYESAEEDAAYIASEVIRKGKSHGWSVDPSESEIAGEIERILARYNIGLVAPGTWGHHPGGTRVFLR